MRKSPSDITKNSFSFQDVLARLETFCAYQDRSKKEVQDKIAAYGLMPEENEKIIEYLIDHRFLDEERFVESYVFGKFRIKRWGRNKIRAALRSKGVPSQLAQRFLNELSGEEYFETVQLLIEKKYVQLAGEKDAYSRKVKVIRFVASKGFELDLIQEAYSGFISKNN